MTHSQEDLGTYQGNYNRSAIPLKLSRRVISSSLKVVSASVEGYHQRIVREAFEIEKYANFQLRGWFQKIEDEETVKI